MADVTIKICGHCGSGKSTIAQVIMEAFRTHEIKVEYEDPDNLGLDQQGMLFAHAKESMKDKTVLIEEIQLRRNGTE